MNITEATDYICLMKLKIYKRTLFVALLVLLVLWFQSVYSGTMDATALYVYPLFSLFCISSLLLFNKYHIRYLRLFEFLGFGSLFLYFSLHFVAEIQYSLSQPELGFQKFLLWIPVLYAMAFLIFPPKRAVLFSALFIVCILIPGITYGFVKWGSSGFENDLALLLQIYTSGLAYISLFFAIAVFKERFAEADSRAQRMASRANTDSLTKAFSRAKISELLDFYFSAASTHNTPLSIMLIDVDGLKRINDVYGHVAGDYVLRRIVVLLGSKLRNYDSLGRIGGDEFLLICPYTDLHQAELLANRLENTISDNEFDRVGKVTVSIGIATSQQSLTRELMLKQADAEMYKQKKTVPTYEG